MLCDRGRPDSAAGRRPLLLFYFFYCILVLQQRGYTQPQTSITPPCVTDTRSSHVKLWKQRPEDPWGSVARCQGGCRLFPDSSIKGKGSILYWCGANVLKNMSNDFRELFSDMNSRECLDGGIWSFSRVCRSHMKNAAGTSPLFYPEIFMLFSLFYSLVLR